VSQTLASSVSAGLERQIRRVLAVVLTLSLPELIANVSSQSSLTNSYSLVMLGLLSVATISTLISSWFFSAGNLTFIVHGLLAGLSIFLWPVMLSDPNYFEPGLKPWIWWTLGIGILSFGLFVRWWFAGLYLVLTSAGWVFLTLNAAGGAASYQSAIQDGVYLFLFGGSILGMINLVRTGARRADEANTQAIESAIEQARVDAVERERQRLDALIHDRVLNTLLVAGKAQSVEDQKGAAQLAQDAIQTLQEALIEPRSTPSVTPLGLFRALRKAALQLLPIIEVRTLGGGSEAISAIEAQAITQATLQAIDNASRHSRATKFELVLDSPAPGTIEITVRDNGLGFRLDRLPKDRIGLRTSLIARMEAIGGSATITTAPGAGTEIRLRWPK
jgi:signal transduction histidine kinase